MQGQLKRMREEPCSAAESLRHVVFSPGCAGALRVQGSARVRLGLKWSLSREGCGSFARSVFKALVALEGNRLGRGRCTQSTCSLPRMHLSHLSLSGEAQQLTADVPQPPCYRLIPSLG